MYHTWTLFFMSFINLGVGMAMRRMVSNPYPYLFWKSTPIPVLVPIGIKKSHSYPYPPVLRVCGFYSGTNGDQKLKPILNPYSNTTIN